MRWAVDGRRLLGGIVARESAMRYAVVNVTVGNSAAAVHGIGVTHKQWQPPRRASDALLLLHAQSGTLHCGRVERRAVCEILGHVSRTGRLEGLLHSTEVVAHVVVVQPAQLAGERVGPAGGDGHGHCRTAQVAPVVAVQGGVS